MTSNIYKGWAAYVLLLLADILVDASIRLSGDDFYAGGVNEEIWFFVHILAFSILLYFLLLELKLRKGIVTRIIFISLNLLLALAIYAVAVYGYVLGTGIDSL